MLARRSSSMRPSRRGLLKAGAVGATGLVVGLHLGLGRITSAFAAAPNPFQGYVRIAPDGTVTVISAHLDMGQGSWTGNATLAAEELDADWSMIRVIGGSGNPALYGNLATGGQMQLTGGSTATASSFIRYREAGAVARAMLVDAASRRWSMPADEITVKNGVVTHRSGKSAGFGALAQAAAEIAPPASVRLKERKDWVFIGDGKLHRLDNVSKTVGAPLYTIDVRLPGMLTAVIAHPPRFGATVKAFDATAARQVRGVVDVVQIPRGVAVVADGFWAAKKGRDALKVTWDETAAETRGTAELMAQYKALLDQDDGAAVARKDGDVGGALKSAARVVKADFEFPYLAHAAMEPLDAVAWKHDGVIEVWGGHQMPDLSQAVAAKIAEVPLDKVKLHVMWTGGSFGRRAVPGPDIIDETVETAKALRWKAPVRVVWTREDDMTGGRYRPMYAHRLEAGLDAQNRPVAWRHRIVGQSIMGDGPFKSFVKNGVDPTSVEGASTLPYAIRNMMVDLHTTDVGVPVLWWRSVGSTHTAYSTEVFIDELAELAGQDPIAFRLGLLGDHPRHRKVLETVRELAGWGQPAPADRFRGVAVAESFNSYVAQVAEVSVAGTQVHVHRIWCAVDCGIAVNPDIIKAQMQGGIGYGLGAILKSAITLDRGVVNETNFDGYQVLTMNEMPHVEVAIVASDEKPTGVGEPGVPPVGPAVANAVAAATGRRIRILPFAKNDLRSV